MTITIINKLKKADNGTSTDIWHKSVLNDCVIDKRSHSQQAGTTLNIGQSISLIIPEYGNKAYKAYREWRYLAKDLYYTASENDIIVIGEIAEDVTSANVTAMLKDYESYHIRLVDDRRNAIGLKGKLSKYASHIYIEGV